MLKQSQGLFCSSHDPASEEAGGAQEAGTGHSPGDGWTPPCLWKGVNEFLALPVHVAFALPIDCLYLSPQVFWLLLFWLLPHPTARDWASSCAGLGVWLGLNPDTVSLAQTELRVLQLLDTKYIESTHCDFLHNYWYASLIHLHAYVLIIPSSV